MLGLSLMGIAGCFTIRPMPKKFRGAGTILPSLFIDSNKKRHPKLFLPKLLAEEAERPILKGADQDRAQQVLLQWADLAERGQLTHKETALDADFLEKIFGDALGYRSVTESPEEFHREKQFFVPGAGTADGALGRFSLGKTTAPVAVIELKGADADLDHDKFNGRTPVQQCWDYLNQLPDTQWGIVSNYVTIRLYHKGSPARAYEEFTITDFRDEVRFRQFYCIFERNGLLGNKVQPPRAEALLGRTQRRQRDVGNELYEDYSNQRLHLIDFLIHKMAKSQDDAIHIAQKILDRIVFVAFCEDRGLLPSNLIDRATKEVPAFSKVTNPRWQNFKALFGLIDKGHETQGIPAFNGGLFRDDPLVDELDLPDEWTNFFSRVGTYDFRDEVNVDVLGHLFEKSVTELEKLRVVGLFGKQTSDGDGLGFMPKSAERKRGGVFYTPPQFTQLIVDRTIGVLVEQRVETLDDLNARVTALRKIKCVDPACGSGAFLIAAYEKFEDAYETVVRAMRINGFLKDADALQEAFPDYILNDNIYGVDLSAEAVEISQLALWIRSARKDKTLADLSKNIVCGNSLITDSNTHQRAFVWAQRFPQVFKDGGGFDAVIGNPPWERMKLQEREFFSLSSPEIAAAVSAADRRKLIAKVEIENPDLWARYQEAKKNAERTLACVRSCDEFPLTAKGDINTYMLFAELARKIVASDGRIGLLVPSGIATDNTTKEFFADVMEGRSLVALYDFENREQVFPDVDGRFKFSVLLMSGKQVKTHPADFVFFAHRIEDLKQADRHIELSDKDLTLLNPNTRTCPIFRSRRDAEITKAVYRQLPILVDDNRKSGGNPWGVTERCSTRRTTPTCLRRLRS